MLKHAFGLYRLPHCRKDCCEANTKHSKVPEQAVAKESVKGSVRGSVRGSAKDSTNGDKQQSWRIKDQTTRAISEVVRKDEGAGGSDTK